MKKFVGNNELIIHNISLLLTKIKLHYEDEASLKKRNIDSPHNFFLFCKILGCVFGFFLLRGGGGCLFLKRLFLYFCRSSVWVTLLSFLSHDR